MDARRQGTEEATPPPPPWGDQMRRWRKSDGRRPCRTPPPRDDVRRCSSPSALRLLKHLVGTTGNKSDAQRLNPQRGRLHRRMDVLEPLTCPCFSPRSRPPPCPHALGHRRVPALEAAGGHRAGVPAWWGEPASCSRSAVATRTSSLAVDLDAVGEEPWRLPPPHPSSCKRGAPERHPHPQASPHFLLAPPPPRPGTSPCQPRPTHLLSFLPHPVR